MLYNNFSQFIKQMSFDNFITFTLFSLIFFAVIENTYVIFSGFLQHINYFFLIAIPFNYLNCWRSIASQQFKFLKFNLLCAFLLAPSKKMVASPLNISKILKKFLSFLKLQLCWKNQAKFRWVRPCYFIL